MASGRNSFDLDTVRRASFLVPHPMVVVCSAAARAAVPDDWPEHVRLLVDIPRADHDELLEHASLFLLVSQDEGRSAGHVRLMSCVTRGTPVVATSVPGIEGYEHLAIDVVPPTDPQRLADAVARAMAHPDEVEERQARIRAEALTYSAYERSLVDWLHDVVPDTR